MYMYQRRNKNPFFRAKVFINQIFKLFDKDNTGVITFRVFCVLTKFLTFHKYFSNLSLPQTWLLAQILMISSSGLLKCLIPMDQVSSFFLGASLWMPMWLPGSIDAEELTQIIVTLYEVEGRSREDGEARAEEIFKLFDEVRWHQRGGVVTRLCTVCTQDGDGEIDETEFCNGCQKDEEFFRLICEGVNRLGLEEQQYKAQVEREEDWWPTGWRVKAVIFPFCSSNRNLDIYLLRKKICDIDLYVYMMNKQNIPLSSGVRYLSLSCMMGKMTWLSM